MLVLRFIERGFVILVFVCISKRVVEQFWLDLAYRVFILLDHANVRLGLYYDLLKEVL